MRIHPSLRCLPFLIAAASVFTGQILAADRPNILLILCDDMGYSDIGSYGGEIETPTLDSLASHGLRYTQFYNTSRCSATRASLLTGLYQHQVGMGWHVAYEDLGGEAWRGDLRFDCVTIAEALKANGYATYMAGKWHVTPLLPSRQDPSKRNWPLQRGFDRFYGTIHGAGSFYDPNSLVDGNAFVAPSGDFYYTDEITDRTIKFIEEHDDEKPFFSYVAYTAAHWPLHALPEDIEKYSGRYDAGWDALRQERFERMKEMGLVDPGWELAPRYPDVPWDSLSDEEKRFHSRCMEVYAAMIDRMDQGIGRIVDSLKGKEALENTVIFFLHDNGGAAEPYGHTRTPIAEDSPKLKPMADGELQYDMEPKQARDGRPMRVGKGVIPGEADTYIGYSKNWGNASNTPFRRHKAYSHEGGISSPLIVHWPAGIDGKDQGSIRKTMSSLIDIMPTCIDLAKAEYPAVYDGRSIQPSEGLSLVPTFQGKTFQRDTLFFEHEGNRAVRQGKWKLVSKPYDYYDPHDVYADLPLTEWELFDIEKDRTETQNLASEHPAKVVELADLWHAWAKRVGAIPRPEVRRRTSEEKEIERKARQGS